MKKRAYGEETPYIPAGPFKVRVIGLHYRFEWPEYVQGLLMCSVCLGAIPLIQTALPDMPANTALAIVILNGFLYLWHTALGDPVVPGWITPAIPLLTAYVLTFDTEATRIQGLVAFEILLGLFAIFLGVTGLAGKLVGFIPAPIKSGIILGAGVAAITSIFKEGGKFETMPTTITICLVITFFLMFSTSFNKAKDKNKVLGFIANLGILPSILLAIIIAPLVGEGVIGDINWGLSTPDFANLWNSYTCWGANGPGWPPVSMFIKAIPTVISIYVVLFGDIVQSKALVADAASYRPDEKMDYNPNRAHLIFGVRNTIMGFIGPDVCMCGPLWAAMQVVVCERYKKGPKAVASMYGGAASFRLGTFTGYWVGPIVSLVTPILNVAMAQTLIVQGFVSCRIGIQQANSFTDLGIAGVIAGLIVCRSAAVGLFAGIAITFVIYGKNFLKGDTDFGHLWSPQVEAMNEAENSLDTAKNKEPVAAK